MTDTRDKLAEAEYFYEQMVQTLDSVDAFKFNLSAFLAAFRSVTSVMQKEFDKCPGFHEWYETQRQIMKADAGMSLLYSLRVVTIHQRPVKPLKDTKLSITLTVPNPSLSFVVTDSDGEVTQTYESPPQTVPRSDPVITHRWFFAEDPESDVLETCRGGLEMLSTIATECEVRFIPVVRLGSTNGQGQCSPES